MNEGNGRVGRVFLAETAPHAKAWGCDLAWSKELEPLDFLDESTWWPHAQHCSPTDLTHKLPELAKAELAPQKASGSTPYNSDGQPSPREGRGLAQGLAEIQLWRSPWAVVCYYMKTWFPPASKLYEAQRG